MSFSPDGRLHNQCSEESLETLVDPSELFEIPGVWVYYFARRVVTKPAVRWLAMVDEAPRVSKSSAAFKLSVQQEGLIAHFMFR